MDSCESEKKKKFRVRRATGADGEIVWKKTRITFRSHGLKH